MKLRDVFRFELAYQARRVSTWLYFAVLVFFAFFFSSTSTGVSPSKGGILVSAV